MRMILQYEMPIREGNVEIELPGESEIIHWEYSPRRLILFWAIVDPNEKKVKRYFNLYDSDKELPGIYGRYRATVSKGPFCRHIFEIGIGLIEIRTELDRMEQEVMKK